MKNYKVTKAHNYMAQEAVKDGVVYSTAETEKQYGYTWIATADGNVSVLTAPDGKQLKISKKELVAAKIEEL